jgi:hypothetical protein
MTRKHNNMLINSGVQTYPQHTKEETVRWLALAALALIAFAGSMTIDPTNANAIVCAPGFYRAGCVGPYGGVVVRRPYVRPYYGGAVERGRPWRAARLPS